MPRENRVVHYAQARASTHTKLPSRRLHPPSPGWHASLPCERGVVYTYTEIAHCLVPEPSSLHRMTLRRHAPHQSLTASGQGTRTKLSLNLTGVLVASCSCCGAGGCSSSTSTSSGSTSPAGTAPSAIPPAAADMRTLTRRHAHTVRLLPRGAAGAPLTALCAPLVCTRAAGSLLRGTPKPSRAQAAASPAILGLCASPHTLAPPWRTDAIKDGGEMSGGSRIDAPNSAPVDGPRHDGAKRTRARGPQ